MDSQKHFLRGMGLYGLDRIENAVLGGLVTAEPVLLVGTHGSAKTLLVERVAEALGMNFYAYDASKAMFEDVIGFPNPETISKGLIEYVPTPISIWDKEFILVDEISRASPAMQNKWLEIVRSRRVMGRNIEHLDYIIAAMNPVGYLGARPLDAALAGRFSFIISMPEIGDMTLDDVQLIVDHVSEADAPGLDIPHFKLNGAKGGSLQEFIARARARFPAIHARYRATVTRYITGIAATLNHDVRPLDGRRLGMLSRNCVAYLSVIAEKRGDETFSNHELNQLLFSCLNASLPFLATGEEIGSTIVTNSHNRAMSLLALDDSRAKVRINFSLSRDPLEMVGHYEHESAGMGENEQQAFFSKLEETLAQSQDMDAFLRGFLALRKAIALFSKPKKRISADLLRRALGIYRKFVLPDKTAMRFLILRLLSEHMFDYTAAPIIDLEDGISVQALCIALKMVDVSEKYMMRGGDRERGIKLYTMLRDKLDEMKQRNALCAEIKRTACCN